VTWRAVQHSRWTAPLVSVLVGLVLLVAAALGGHPAQGVAMCGVMATLGLAVLGATDSAADLKASACAGVVVMLATTAGFVYEIAQGHDGSPYLWLCASGAITYLVAVVIARARR
jgi:hypothetical protein